MFLLRLDQDSYTATIQVDESIKSRETCMLEDRKMAKILDSIISSRLPAQ